MPEKFHYVSLRESFSSYLHYLSFLPSSCGMVWGVDPWSTSRPHRVTEMPAHHRAPWASPKITLPMTAWTRTKDKTRIWMLSLQSQCVSATSYFRELTVEMKLDAVVVTVALAEEEQCLRALEKKVHMTALQMNSRPPHSSRRGMWSWKHTGERGSSSQLHMGNKWKEIPQRCAAWFRSSLRLCHWPVFLGLFHW